jgi:hypothetical protein
MKKILIVLFLLAFMEAKPQAGQYIQVWGGAQSTQVNNSQESYYGSNADDKVTPLETDRAFGGIDYIYNFHNLFGIQTGLSFSQQGQKYSGSIYHDGNDTSSALTNINFTSSVLLNYVKLPLMFRFNSGRDEDETFNLSIYGGFEFAYLTSATVTTTPALPAIFTDQKVDFKQFYKTIDFGWAAGAQVNIFVSKYWGICIGGRYSRSLVDVESKSVNYTGKNYPAEWYYPISVKKSIKPSQSDQYDRFSSKNNAVGLYVGVFIPIGAK